MLCVVWVGQTCRCALLHLDTLTKRRSITCVMFIFDVLSARVKSPKLSVLDLITRIGFKLSFLILKFSILNFVLSF
jgi:hypothetical protein